MTTVQLENLMMRRLLATACLAQVCILAGCSSAPAPPETVPTFPVTGVVQIDGKPQAGVKVMLVRTDDPLDVFNPILGAAHQGVTDDTGKFNISTYNANDGAPVGDYNLAFYWEGPRTAAQITDPDAPQLNPVAAKFNRKYGDPGKPTQAAVKVEEGKTTDVGVLDLKTK